MHKSSMAYWQYCQYQQLQENLQYDEILLVLDFSENYAMQLPREVQSMHWVSVQATLFVAVLTRHARQELYCKESTPTTQSWLMNT